MVSKYVRPSKVIPVTPDISLRVYDLRKGWFEIVDRDNGDYTQTGIVAADVEYIDRFIVALAQLRQQIGTPDTSKL